MRIFMQEVYVRRLKNKLPKGMPYDTARSMTIEECVAALRDLSGKDYGNDPEAWERWWKEECKRIGED